MFARTRTRRRKKHTSHTGPRFFAAGCALVILLGVVLAIAGVASGAALIDSWVTDLPDISDSSVFTLPQTTRVYSADGQLLANLYLENRQVVALDKISPYLLKAVVAVEDERFYLHDGVDFVGLARALVTNITTGRREGASTLTQQFIRNTVLSDERFEISYRRKVREGWLALELERNHSKDEILSMYLNTVYYGEGAYGAESAALTFFGKHAADLTIAEAAMLAGLPQAPSRLSPYTNLDGAIGRQQWVLSRMLKNNVITQAEYDAARVEQPTLVRAPEINEQGVYSAPYFVAHVKKLLQDQYGTGLVFKGGLKVYTTLDTTLQTYAEKAVTGVLDRKDDPDAALVAIDPRNGYIKALVGGRDWKTNKFNFATQAKRQPGSSFKVFTLVTALESGMPPSRRLNSSSPARIETGAEPWIVGNAEGGGGRGYITLQQATVGSVNTAFARLAKELGAASIAETANRMGIETPLKPYLSITLGGQEVTPLEMASAFGTLANEGRHYKPLAITKVVDAKGETIFEAEPQGEQVVDPKIAYAATSILKGVISGGTATRARIGRPAAGKTGTTQDYRDAWFVGYTPQLVASVWMGYTPERPMRNVHGRRAFGGTFGAPIWHDFMIKALEDEPELDFKKAAAPTYTWKKAWDVPNVKMPNLVGMTEAAAKKRVDALVNDYELTVGTAFSDTVASGIVTSQAPEAGTKLQPGDTISI
ncbi:MAG TPA: penicillin-binding protein, partial [Coriobacteriia bacterium]|nr:penicillin-binding protein [Coriobacteriia bacterium]